MKLIIGLGNPGEEYANTRHNIGFMAIDTFAKNHKVEFTFESKFKGMLATMVVNHEKCILLKPMTYMNLSGESVSKVMNFYKIDVEDILVISDDLDSRFARVRIRDHGSAGGHNGHKNIVQYIKTEQYKRIKIGIDRNPDIPVVNWVLKKFTSDEISMLAPSLDKVCSALEDFTNGVPFVKIASLYSSK